MGSIPTRGTFFNLDITYRFNNYRRSLKVKVIVWNKNIAYIVGLLVTDGSLSSDGRHIIMRSTDVDLLVTFKSLLALKVKIGVTKDHSSKKPCYRLQFGDVVFYRWLLSIGITPAKTYIIGEIRVPNLYFRDFLRGHLDGDGSIFTYLDRFNTYKGRRYVNHRLYIKFISV